MFTSLRARFVGLLVLGLTLAVLAIGVLFFQYRAQIAHTEQLGQAAAVATTLDELFAHVIHASNTSRRYVLSEDQTQLSAYQDAVAAVPAVLDRIQGLTQEQTGFEEAFENLTSRLDHKLSHLGEILDLHRDANVAQMRSLLIGGDGLQRLEAFRDAVAAFRSIGYGLADTQLEQVRIGVLVQVAIVVLMVFCGIVWAAILGNEAIRNILVPVSSMNAQIKRIAAGDFRDTLPVGRRDEIGGLAEQINIMTAQLRTARDEREQAQAELATERQNLVDAIEAIDEGFAAYDSEGRLLQCNRRFLDYYPTLKPIAKPGITYEALLRKKAESGAEPVAVGREDAFVAERLADILVTNTVRECVLADGRVLQRSSYRTSYGGLVAVYVNLTEIKRAEERLRELNRELDARVQKRTVDLNTANEKLQLVNAELGAIILSAPVAVVVLSPERHVTTWNPAAVDMTGLQKASVEPSLANIVEPNKRNQIDAFLNRVYAGESPASTEMRLRHQNGQTIEANLSASVLTDGAGEPIGAILIMADLTESRALQQQFQQSQKMEVVAKLTAGLAHDFNNLLAIVISNIELLESRVPDDQHTQELLRSAKKASLSGVALNKKLLAFSRDQSPELEGLDLVQELTFLEPLLQVTLGEGVKLDIAPREELWPVLTDRSLLQSAALNLAVNARDAMSGDGVFDISARNVTLDRSAGGVDLAGDFVRVCFSDSGAGMSADVISRAFQPFFTTKDFGKSSGLGLSMVYGFVKQTGGDIRIESTVGVGTQITMYLPRATEMTRADDVLLEGLNISAGNDEHILVVEDNAEMRRALTLQLAELGFHPIQAESGATALDLIQADVPVDLMLTDIVMPGGMDGRELANQARQMRPDLPIVFISGYPALSEDGIEVSWESLGIKVLAKPVSQMALGARINESLKTQAIASEV
ncbi:PAS/PAC sensor hybrid histidine kinase [Candidatus Rhodobacter oscarellae]|uniref:histidine kinase n=1 Tax=Candidatus Rhodobacter oscarellae TaxID=1675527 RepID=A0A0J9EAX2_9RHOB|nr:PAS-domain containing protein [Candidatus Rhodobacter lobularis]KMW59935.1 PAS/PAC sensor hybrid histidine kinase [Candidatus Rhodobacter lobularis]